MILQKQHSKQLNLKFSIPGNDSILEGVKKIQEELLIDPDIITQIIVNLASNRHILLAGPVGTGKTTLAIMISKLIWRDNCGYYPDVHTATAEWSTQDVIGGISPRIHQDKPTYEITLGCVSETIKSNWADHNSGKRTGNIHNGQKYRGTWLIIDEFNRADLDKAFGPLFTGLETRILKIPTSEAGKTYEEIHIPYSKYR